MKVKLVRGEIVLLREAVTGSKGKGGYQNLIAHLWYHLDEDSGEIDLSYVLMERIHRYAFKYGNPLWRRSLRKIFRRTLGANLDRGLILG